MEDELLKKMELFQNKSAIDTSNQQMCYVKLPSNCIDLMKSSYFHGLFTSKEAFSRGQDVPINRKSAATAGMHICCISK